jgi:hypothetical protein
MWNIRYHLFSLSVQVCTASTCATHYVTLKNKPVFNITVSYKTDNLTDNLHRTVRRVCFPLHRHCNFLPFAIQTTMYIRTLKAAQWPIQRVPGSISLGRKATRTQTIPPTRLQLLRKFLAFYFPSPIGLYGTVLKHRNCSAAVNEIDIMPRLTCDEITLIS